MFINFRKKTPKEEPVGNVAAGNEVIIKEQVTFIWTCPKCGGKNEPTRLIEGRYLQCWQCGLRIRKTENGLWEKEG